MITIYTSADFQSSEIPTEPGVYLYRDEKGELLYIGKAKNLRNRVKNYFTSKDQPLKTRHLVTKIRSIDWIIVNNEVEALLLENMLIKQHTPRYNIALKDAKTFAYIALTRDLLPRILTSRKISRKLESFGPYTDGFARQDLQRLVIRVFKLRTCKELPKRACLNFHIGLCTAPCVGNVSTEQYQKQVEQARSFLKGNYEKTLTTLNDQMNTAASELNFERALELRNQITSINILTKKQIVDNERRFDQDVMAFKQKGEEMHVVQMGVRKGVLRGKREFSIDMQPYIEQEFLKAFYNANEIPNEILLNKVCWQDSNEKNSLEEFLSQLKGAHVTLTIPTRSDKLSLVRLAEKNLDSLFDENSVLVRLQKELNLPAIPKIIECFDISNLGQEHVVSGMVRFKNAKPDKNNYRRFKIRTVEGQDDFASMHEVITRRYKRLLEENEQMPDLIVIDGGPGQVSVAQTALHSLGLQLPLIGLAKEHEEIYLPNESVPLQFNKNCRMMLLLRQIRDATHDFALRY
ncbi:MAG: excinuclease ABC subunit UvrC, partial [Crenarchaeota archaeon]|nr:excinuclease ABC subunit UvrC [Thermoproteota archaeon]